MKLWRVSEQVYFSTWLESGIPVRMLGFGTVMTSLIRVVLIRYELSQEEIVFLWLRFLHQYSVLVKNVRHPASLI